MARKTTVDTSLLAREFGLLKTARSSVEAVWDEIEKFINPLGNGRAADPNASVQWKRLEVWDSTAIDGAEKLAASIHGTVTSPAIRWFGLAFRDKALQDDREAAEWLEDTADRIYEALQDSDFNTEIGSSYTDYACYGNTVILEEAADPKKWKGLDFTSVPLREVYFVEDSRGKMLRFYRFLNWTPVQIVDFFGEENVPEQIRARAKLPQGVEEKVELAFCIFRRPEFEKYLGTDKVLAPERRPFGSVYFLVGDGTRLGEEDGYYEMPAFLGRWQRTPGSPWGHGRGHIALPTVKYLNGMCEADFTAAEKVLDPTMMTTERNLLSDPDARPGKLVVVRDPDKLKPLVPPTRFDVADAKITELRAMVRSYFHVDDLQMKDSPAMTATEAQIRYEIMNRLLGSTLARLQSDVLDPLIHLTLAILMRNNQLKPMPASVRAAGGQYNVEYHGPLARAQRTDEVAAIERLASFVAALANMEFADAREVFDAVEAIREVAKRLGCPAAVLRAVDDVAKRIKLRQELQARAAQAEAARAEGEALERAGTGVQALSAAGASPVTQPAQPAPVVAPPFNL